MKYLLVFLTVLFSIQSQAGIYNITDFGAVPGELSTQQIQKTIDACAENGGGMVLVPAGTYITGTIQLKSHVNLHLEQGAVLKGSLNLSDYLTSFVTHGMVFCENATQVSITGQGIIDAQGTHFYDILNSISRWSGKRMTICRKGNFILMALSSGKLVRG